MLVVQPLKNCSQADSEVVFEEEEDFDYEAAEKELANLTLDERGYLQQIIDELSRPEAKDPKLEAVKWFLTSHRTPNPEGTWLEHGCIVFSQYYDTAWSMAKQLALILPDEPIALYAGGRKSGIFLGSSPMADANREEIKKRVKDRSIRLIFATDAASEGLNLQTLGSLINVDLPWNPPAWNNGWGGLSGSARPGKWLIC